MNHYQESNCRNGYLHNYVQVQQTPKGVVERCVRCKKTIFFPHAVPNHVYLAHHIRSALQPSDPRFQREWPNFKP